MRRDDSAWAHAPCCGLECDIWKCLDRRQIVPTCVAIQLWCGLAFVGERQRTPAELSLPCHASLVSIPVLCLHFPRGQRCVGLRIFFHTRLRPSLKSVCPIYGGLLVSLDGMWGCYQRASDIVAYLCPDTVKIFCRWHSLLFGQRHHVLSFRMPRRRSQVIAGQKGVPTNLGHRSRPSVRGTFESVPQNPPADPLSCELNISCHGVHAYACPLIFLRAAFSLSAAKAASLLCLANTNCGSRDSALS